jgi:hypothetical protein
MFNNVALDVAIGLIFIYLLYSLLATTIKELIATIFSYRGRMLERGIEQMLDGKNYSYYWWDKVINFILWLRVWVIENFVRRNKEYKGSKNDQNGIINRKDFFSKTSIPKTPSNDERVRSKLNKKSKLFASNITTHPLYKRSAENSLFFKKPAYLNADVFSDILIDILGSEKTTRTNEPALMKDIASYVQTNFADRPDLQKILGIYIEQANGDLQRFKLLIENWYDDTMKRVSGWYKRQANRILMIIGLLLAIYANIDTIKIGNILANNKEAREQLAILAAKTKDNYSNEVSRIKKESVNLKDSVIKGTDGQPDTVVRVTVQYEQISDEQLKENYDKVNEDISEANDVLGLGWYLQDSCKKCDTQFKPTLDSLEKVLIYVKKNETSTKAIDSEIKTQKNKIDQCYAQFRLPWNAYSVVGWLITALAISLGAPFWFDLLNKFVNLRVSGEKPEEAKKDGTSSKSEGLNQKPNPKAFG